MKWFSIILILVLLSSCNPCRKINKLLLKHPECLKLDSVLVADTFIVNRVESDTLFKFSEMHDTVVVKNDRLTIKYFYNKTTDSVYLQGVCDTDTLIRYRWRYRERILARPEGLTFWHKLGIGMFILLLLLIIAYLITRRLRNEKD